ncbi:MAG: hypothetical protein WKF37_01130 [Bryobacteraceae bacterium]
MKKSEERHCRRALPQIWDSSWFNWVQYNSSISDPLVRNIGEALGVRAVAKLYGSDASAYEWCASPKSA